MPRNLLQWEWEETFTFSWPLSQGHLSIVSYSTVFWPPAAGRLKKHIQMTKLQTKVTLFCRRTAKILNSFLFIFNQHFHAEWIKMPPTLPVSRQSDYLIRIVYINSHTKYETGQIQIIWLLKEPTDLALPYLQKKGISEFSKTRASRKHAYIILTPFKPYFCIGKVGFTGVYIIFLFLLKNIDCGYSLEPRGGSNEYSQSMFWAEI